ncbi:hypothetical protein EW145_g2539 [Phellinidium pouzarii]|uniref:Uncharacterized protein n=1 Tax=Phellinidium pouzarii TaxID=167371 RepID=A0A4S4LAV6_9AGAM|nr:hypothetical protein EW145_g2539 [Phellinidium pouzarii]
MYNGSQPDFHGSTPNLNIEMPSPRSTPNTNYSPSTQNTVYQNRPSLSSNLHASSPTLSYSPSASAYGTPPEMPAAQPLRTGSPVLLTPGSRTISAAAFKRPQMRSPSGSGPNADTRPLPDVSPLALRKKSVSGPGLPGSPYPQARDGPPGRRSNDSANRPEQEYDDSYEFISSYGEPGDSTPGYGGGKFATNLEGDELR